tara:strand:- start:292 stop:465 length:174 start_codon:yes stop_codon:yes gene_type:complete
VLLLKEKIMEKVKWWQKKVRGWVVPFWYSDTPLYSKRFSELSDKQINEIVDKIRKDS